MTNSVAPQTHALTAAQVETYGRDGFLTPVPLLDAQQAEAYREHFERFEAALGEPVKRANSLHLVFPWAHDLACQPMALVAQLLAPGLLASDVMIWGTLVLCKLPHDQGFVPWHQDGAYADYLAGAPSLSVWIALTPSHEENGCMHFSPGSHCQVLQHSFNEAPGNMLMQKHQLVGDYDKTAVSVVLQPGELSVHHLNLVHGSRANNTAEKRIGFIIRYTTLATASSPHLDPKTFPSGLVGVNDRPTERPHDEAVAYYCQQHRDTPPETK